ncbi:MAG: hypothetical protein SWX82_12450 [Cyanobacteriota bacterium]|nr:hypothetical protein [Cyanobacteriota bacterium]
MVKIFWLAMVITAMVITAGIAVGILQHLDRRLMSQNFTNTESN